MSQPLLDHLPATSTELLILLDLVYPERCPDPKEDPSEMWMYAGKRELIRQMKDILQHPRKHKPNSVMLAPTP